MARIAVRTSDKRLASYSTRNQRQLVACLVIPLLASTFSHSSKFPVIIYTVVQIFCFGLLARDRLVSQPKTMGNESNN